MQSNILLFLEICEFWVLYIYTYTNFNEILINSWIYIHILFTLPLIFHNAIRLGYKSSTKSMKLVKMGQIRAFFFCKIHTFCAQRPFPKNRPNMKIHEKRQGLNFQMHDSVERFTVDMQCDLEYIPFPFEFPRFPWFHFLRLCIVMRQIMRYAMDMSEIWRFGCGWSRRESRTDWTAKRWKLRKVKLSCCW